MRNYLYIVILLSATIADGDEKSQIREDIEKLKINAENSQSNHGQYKKNFEVVSANVVELDKALKNLKNMKKQVLDNSKKADENKLALDKSKLTVDGYIRKEEEKKLAEQKQIDDFQKKIEDLKLNQQKRDENIVKYKAQIQEIEKEKQEWDEQKKNTDLIVAELTRKEQAAAEQRKSWSQKEAAYKLEVEKWGRESKFADSNYRKYNKLSP